MEQVPAKNCDQHYLIIGNGKIAQHFSHFFNFLQISFTQWNRKDNSLEKLQNLVKKSDTVLILITDDQIQNFYNQNLKSTGKTCVHFSGASSFEGIIGCHPLSMFSNRLFLRKEYEKIFFICDENVNFKKLFPKLPNNFVNIPLEKKALYHSMCVMSGNFTTILWQKVLNDFNKKLMIPREALDSYRECVFENLSNHDSQLTGPLARKDMVTIKKNIESLAGDPFQDVYKSFVNALNLTEGLK